MITSPTVWGALNDCGYAGVFRVTNAGAPTNGTSGTGAGILGPGSEIYDTTNQVAYIQVGTLASPYWQAFGGSVSGNGGDSVLRQRVTAAQVNAGLTLLAAIPGMKYRVVDITMISIGGAAAGATAVRINGTQASSVVQLLSVAVAALTQSTVVRAGAANATVLADGASFVACDANTAITIDKSGGSLTGSTNIDVILTYSIEK